MPVQVTAFARSDEGIVGISPLFPKAGDIAVHPFDLNNTLR